MFPNYYQPVQQPIQPLQQPLQQPIQAMQQPIPPVQQPIQPNQPIQNGGYVIVQSEEEVRRYPVAHGNIVTFRIENQPVVIEKSMGYSQFDTPHYEKYKLIKEDMPIPEEHKDEYLLKSDYEPAYKSILDTQNEILSQNKEIQSQLDALKSKVEAKKTTTKKEVE